MKSLLKLSAIIGICAALGACSTNKGVITSSSIGSSDVAYAGKLPIKPEDQTMVLAATNVQELNLAIKKAHNTKMHVRIILTPGFYSVKNTIVLPRNTTLTTFNPTNGGLNGPWVISDVKNNDFIGPVVLMHPGSALIGVNVKQLNSNPAVKIEQLPVTVESLQVQTIKDQSLIFIDSALTGYKKGVLTLNGVTLTNMFLHKTAPSIRVGYSAPIEVHFVDSVINYPKGVLILPKTTKIKSVNSIFNTDLSGLNNIKLDASTYHETHKPKLGIVAS